MAPNASSRRRKKQVVGNRDLSGLDPYKKFRTLSKSSSESFLQYYIRAVSIYAEDSGELDVEIVFDLIYQGLLGAVKLLPEQEIPYNIDSLLYFCKELDQLVQIPASPSRNLERQADGQVSSRIKKPGKAEKPSVQNLQSEEQVDSETHSGFRFLNRKGRFCFFCSCRYHIIKDCPYKQAIKAVTSQSFKIE
jgi:hypothetical protein